MTPGYIIVKYPSGNSVVNIYLKDSALVENICGFFADYFAQSIKLPRDHFYHLCSDRYYESLSDEERPKTFSEHLESGIPEEERFVEIALNGNENKLIIVRNSFDNINSLASNIVHKLFTEYNDVLNGDAIRIVPEVNEKIVPYVYTVEVIKDHQGYERPYLTAKSSDGIEFSGFVKDIHVMEDQN